jgi:Transglycosylase-like domain
MAVLMSILALAVPAPERPVYVPHRARVCKRECRQRRHKRKIVRPYNSKLNRMAWCESTGRWFINTGNGYFGGLQFALSTWWSVGGRGYPHHNTKLEQKYRAVILIKRAGYGPWPVCGYV